MFGGLLAHLNRNALMAALAIALSPCSSAAAPIPVWHIYSLNSKQPASEITSLDGAIWFTTGLCCASAPSFGRISFDGKITLFSTEDLFPYEITSGGGRLLMTSFSLVANIVAYSPVTRELVVYPAVGPSGDQLQGGQIAWTATRDIWFLEHSHIARLRPAGNIVEYATSAQPTGALVVGPDKSLWFTLDPGIVARIDPVTSAMSQFTLPADSCNSTVGSTYSLASGTDGDVYAACFRNPYSPTSYFYRIDPGDLRIRRYGPFEVRVYGLAVGADANLYVADGYPNALAYFDSRHGIIGYYYTPNGDGVGALTLGPDGNVWMVMGETPAIGTLILRRRRP
jgi:streptogramin lyase